MTEKHLFEAHKKLMLDVVLKQTGSIDKAVMEGCTNAIEAGASVVEIEIAADRFSIRDNGRGFRSKKEIKECFKVFGAPHLEGENRIWKNFRIGRGQLFSFGRNVWRTNKFRMEVDVNKCIEEGKADGNPYDIGYTLESDLPVEKGCAIEVSLYNKLHDWDIRNLGAQVAQNIRYVDARVTVNGNLVSTPPATAKWDLITDSAYIKVDGSEGGLRIYNLGVYVYTDYDLGVSGDVVSRMRLDVNFARNQILSTCLVWKEIKDNIKAKISTFILNKKSLTDEERRHIIRGYKSGEYNSNDIQGCPLFKDVAGRFWSARELSGFSGKKWTFAESGSREGDLAMQMGLGVVLDSSVKNIFEYTGDAAEFFFAPGKGGNKFTDSLSSVNFTGKVDNLISGINQQYMMIPLDQYSKKEDMVVRAVSCQMQVLRLGVRSIHVGSGFAPAWTDGRNYICINRQFIKAMDGTLSGFTELAFLILHEMLHDDSDERSHVHCPEFFQKYHNMSSAAILAANYMWRNYFVQISKPSKKMEKEKKRMLDSESLNRQFRDLDMEKEKKNINRQIAGNAVQDKIDFDACSGVQ